MRLITLPIRLVVVVLFAICGAVGFLGWTLHCLACVLEDKWTHTH